MSVRYMTIFWGLSLFNGIDIFWEDWCNVWSIITYDSKASMLDILLFHRDLDLDGLSAFELV